jgi:superfamily I DNA and RNA helicase
MKPQKFITTEPISDSGKDCELKVWNTVKRAFSDKDCIGYWRYPLFAKVGEVRKEPDVLIGDRELGVILIEIACVTIDQIVAVNGEQWQFENSDILLGSPGERVNRQLQALLGYCDRESQIFRKITGRGIVALPLIKQEEWQQKGFDQLPGCPPVIFQDQLGKVGVLERIQQSTPMVTGENLDDEQWTILKAVIGGTPVLRKPPRTISAEGKTRAGIVATLQEKLYELDLQQEEIGKQIPPGPQRIRGIAGSGKTVLLCQKAAHMHLKHPDWDIALVFFTRSLYDQIEKLVDQWLRRFSNGDIHYDNNRVKNKLKVLHAWGGNSRPGLYQTICRKHQVTPLTVRDTQKRKPNEGLADICNRLLNGTEIQPIFDAILIDEGQDLVTENDLKYYEEQSGESKQVIYWMAYQVLRPIQADNPDQRRLIWAYDEAQSLDSLKIPGYKETLGDTLGEILAGKNSGPLYTGNIKKNEVMKRCYRTPGPILTAAHAIGMGLLRPNGMLAGLTDQKSWQAIGYEVKNGDFKSVGKQITLHRPPENSPNPIPKLWDDPVLEFETYDSREEELEALAARIKHNLSYDRLLPSRDILVVVLGGTFEAINLEKKVGSFLMEEGIDVYIPTSLKLNQLSPTFPNTDPDIFWKDGGVTVSRIHRAKGNEANIVYVVGLDNVAKNEDDPNLRNQLFVGLTRSRGWACLSGTGDYPLYDEIRNVITSGDSFTFTFKRPPKINTGEEEET